MKQLLLFSCLLWLLAGCEKDLVVDKKTVLSAKINALYLNTGNASAVLDKSNYVTGRAQLTLSGEDDSSRIVILIKDYTGNTGILSLNNTEAIAVVTKKSTNVTDTASSGRLIIQDVTSNFYSIPELKPATGFATGQMYKSENIAGSFDFVTRASVQVTAGIFGIAFNK